jgi:hypothetical protein
LRHPGELGCLEVKRITLQLDSLPVLYCEKSLQACSKRQSVSVSVQQVGLTRRPGDYASLRCTVSENLQGKVRLLFGCLVEQTACLQVLSK